MATVYGTNTTTKRGTVQGGDQLNRVYEKGQVFNLYDVYEASSIASGTVIKIGPFPKGAMILPDSFIVHDALGTGVTLAVGDDDDSTAADADRYVEATAAATAGVIQFNDAAACIDKVPYVLGKEAYLTITTGGATASGTLKAFIRWTY